MNKMVYKQEKLMYPDVAVWFENLLSIKYKKAEIQVVISANEYLSSIIQRNKYNDYFPLFHTYLIQVDIVGFIKIKNMIKIGFVECKLNSINLKDISQLIGYSKVVIPEYSIIISPKGIGTAINSLIKVYRRYDILEYSKEKRIKIAQWDIDKKEILTETILPPGDFT